MKRGCPQRSSFGPLLWDMFENDLLSHVEDANLTYEELIGRANLPSLFKRRLQDSHAHIQKSLLFSSIKKNTHALRKSDFLIPRCNNTRYSKHSFRYLGPFLWSKLNKDLKDSPTLAIIMIIMIMININIILLIIIIITLLATGY